MFSVVFYYGLPARKRVPNPGFYTTDRGEHMGHNPQLSIKTE
jgi:hypothetical protein